MRGYDWGWRTVVVGKRNSGLSCEGSVHCRNCGGSRLGYTKSVGVLRLRIRTT